MPSFTNQQLITDLQSVVADMLTTVSELWQPLPKELMLNKEAPGKWSAAQCLMHLNSYGNYYLPAMKISIERAESKGWHSKVFKSSFIGNWFTQLMLPKEGKPLTKMKAPQNHTPLLNDNSEEALKTFIQQGNELLTLLKCAESVDLRKAKTPISISRYIRLPLGDTFRFYVAHQQRHIRQAAQAIATAKVGVQMSDGVI